LRRLKNRKESQNLGTIDLKPGERLDDLQRNGYRIIQDPDKFCFGMDAVLLSGFASAPDGGRVLDLGTGTGIIPILMAAKTGAKELVGLEIQPESAEMANRSVILNDLEEKVKIVEGDIKEAGELFEAASFDVVTSNPPYMIGGHGLQNPDGPKAIARHEVLCDLEDVIKAAARCLKPGGKFYMVHRPFRLAEIMVVMNRYKLEPKRMRLVYPFIDKEPSMVLIEGARGGKSRITVEPPLIIYESQHKYTKEIYDIYGF
jgi:tRNA1Val (adenine37-N6)-methyltransferase